MCTGRLPRPVVSVEVRPFLRTMPCRREGASVRFLLQSLFWCAVVSAFSPRDLAADGAAADLEASAAQFCETRAAVCSVGVEAAKLAVELSLAAATAARDALDEDASTS